MSDVIFLVFFRICSQNSTSFNFSHKVLKCLQRGAQLGYIQLTHKHMITLHIALSGEKEYNCSFYQVGYDLLHNGLLSRGE